MKKFLLKILAAFTPFFIFTGVVIYMDFFKVLGFRDYYGDEQIVGLNREMITTTTYNTFRDSEHFDSFIFGNSRSEAYKCDSWKKHLPEKSVPFHFDASGEGIWGISRKISYIDENKDSLRNALIIIDGKSLVKTEIRYKHLFVSMPCVSKESSVKYYLTFLKASLNLHFLTAYADYRIFGKYRNYMGYFIREKKFNDVVDKKNCNIIYGADFEIEEDSVGYYENRIKQGIFYERPVKNHEIYPVTDKETEQLRLIKKIFLKHKTNYKIVISPLYDQIPLEKEQLNLLYDIFGKENVYDFSGKNEFTESVFNYYENSHYRPHVAAEIMDIIYEDD
ncbi:MAG: hypothetical protein CSB55_08735 [Candidatus Cloacimonadota bacterium]|nr:MAG: hypothetical protein CSB55_08735 [Candidatus Cloacimonadota bacterium]